LRKIIGILSSTSYKERDSILSEASMGAKIPRLIRLQVIRALLEGKSRDKIAQKLDISRGAVSGIWEDTRRDDSQFDLLRGVAVKLKNRNLDIQSFAPLVRLYEVLREKGLLAETTGQESLESMQNRMEPLIIALEVFCFKRRLSIEDFVGLVTNMYDTADNLGIPIQRFPSYITELIDRINTLTTEADQIEANKQAALRDYGMTLELLREYNANKPFLLQIQKYREQSADANKKIRECQHELEKEKFWNKFEEQYTWSISADELNKASVGIGLSPIDNFYRMPSLSSSDLKKWAMDIFYHPSRYVKVIKEIRAIYNSQNTSNKLRV
jgi:transcriptional regulator with XRE-family HTH domain